MANPSLLVPGVYRRHRVRSQTFPRPRTDIGGFVGVAGPRHVHEAVLIDDWADYEERFLTDDLGHPLGPPLGSRLAAEVRAFFANGGARCWVVNVAPWVTDPATGVPMGSWELVALLLGIPRGSDPVGPDGDPLQDWGLELVLRREDVSLVTVPGLFATWVQTEPRVADGLPPRFEEGAFRPCSSFRDLDDVQPGQLPPDRLREEPLLDHDQIRVAQQHLLERCDRAKTRVFAILAPPPGLDPSRALDWRRALGSFDGAALYWPWLYVQEVPGDEVRLESPTGHVAGLFASTDIARGPHFVPAREALTAVVGTEVPVDDRVQALVYPEGINPIRTIPHNGLQVWGARTLMFETVEAHTGEPLAYVNVRRGFTAIERAAEELGQVAVFEPHRAVLWMQICHAITGYLLTLFNQGVLQGASPQESFFVRCDNRLNPPDNVAKGIVTCEIGVALAVPAEFVMFRLGRHEGVVEIQEH